MEKSKKEKLETYAILGTILVLTVIFCLNFEKLDWMPAEEQAVVADMKAVGFMFDPTLLTIEGEESHTDAVATGPMIGLKEIPALGSELPPKGSDNYTRYQEVQLVFENGNWVLSDAILRD